MSRQVRNIHLYLPAFFPFFFSFVETDDVIQQAKLCLHVFYQIHPEVCNGKKSRMGKTNSKQVQHKLYFIIKWLLIHISCSYSCFDQSKIVTKTQHLPFLLSSCSSL